MSELRAFLERYEYSGPGVVQAANEAIGWLAARIMEKAREKAHEVILSSGLRREYAVTTTELELIIEELAE
jgi:hypothetical protein